MRECRVGLCLNVGGVLLWGWWLSLLCSCTCIHRQDKMGHGSLSPLLMPVFDCAKLRNVCTGLPTSTIYSIPFAKTDLLTLT